MFYLFHFQTTATTARRGTCRN
ncbi:unnamed protein product [Callosobruchus maculatus]|uniref:Uncharacterized protein n=1 Tax=Callosobruchus maculatus TaxID=64391 RepID=A0A653CUL5_CALMS|nr:unnamed protein product [Callosobruchus maculatus]